MVRRLKATFRSVKKVAYLLDDEVDDDWDDEDAKAMMVVKDAMDCIGCGACGRTCPKDCFTFVAA